MRVSIHCVIGRDRLYLLRTYWDQIFDNLEGFNSTRRLAIYLFGTKRSLETTEKMSEIFLEREKTFRCAYSDLVRQTSIRQP